MNNTDRKTKNIQQGGAGDDSGKIDSYSLGLGMGIACLLCCSLMVSVLAAGGGGGYYLYKNKKMTP